MQPEWARDGSMLYFISDSGGWWNLYCCSPFGSSAVFCLHSALVEFGGPAWWLGSRSYAVLDDERLFCTFNYAGQWRCGLITPDFRGLNRAFVTSGGKPPQHEFKEISLPYTHIAAVTASLDSVTMLAGSPLSSPAVVQLDLSTNGVTVVRSSSDMTFAPEWISMPEQIEVPMRNGARTYANFYPPKNPNCIGLPGELPPLLVIAHGGPTACARLILNLTIQYYTSRGWAVADVNYPGSTGFGTEYRESLKGNWGILDWLACVDVASYLADRGRVDRKRMVISGGSAGGYTVLGALVFQNKVLGESIFCAGASHYGVADLTLLKKGTHKFESRYLDELIGTYETAPSLYEERSPLTFAEYLRCPVIFFQGADDKTVPPDQAEVMVTAMTKNGVPAVHKVFAGEGHGFRRACNVRLAILGPISLLRQALRIQTFRLG